MDKRYKHILVPLDGSELAELALIDAFSLAKLSQAEVTLLQVITPIDNVLDVGPGQTMFMAELWETNQALAIQYLESICERVKDENMTIHLAVEMGPAAEVIIDDAHRHPIDLIVMVSHGRSGLRRWVYGSVADKVLRGAELPILLVRPQSR